MGYVTHSTTETVNELSQTTSIHFESFEDFLKWDNMKSFEAAELNVSSEGPVEITTRNIDLDGTVDSEWIQHNTESQPVDDSVTVEVRWKSCNGGFHEEEGRADHFAWNRPLSEKTRISHYRIIKPQEE